MVGTLATTTCAVTRGETVDALGDDIATGAAVAGLERVPMSIIEKSRKVFAPDSDEVRTVRYVVGRVPNGAVDVRRGDGLADNLTGKHYIVDEIQGGERTIAGTRPLILDLRYIGPPS